MTAGCVRLLLVSLHPLKKAIHGTAADQSAVLNTFFDGATEMNPHENP